VDKSSNDILAIDHEKSMKRISTLSHISETIALGNNSEETWNLVLKEIVTLMNATIGSIYLITDDYKKLRCLVEYSDIYKDPVITEGIDLRRLKNLPIMDVINNFTSIKLDDISDELNQKLNVSFNKEKYEYRSSICSPILFGSTVKGAIAVSSVNSFCFTKDDLAVLDSIGYIIGSTLYNEQLQVMLRDSREALAKAFNDVSNARLAERTNLSRELHDDIGQSLTSISLRLKALQKEMDIDTILDRVNDLRIIVNNAHNDLSRVLLALHPSYLEENHIFDSLKILVSEIISESNISIKLDIPEYLMDIPPNIELIIYRCTQESVSNIIQHSHATMAEITLSMGDNSILLEIKDNGIGLPAQSYVKGSGLAGMKHRVQEVGGVFSADSTKEGSTNISIMLPLK